jgi:hypothetical protein
MSFTRACATGSITLTNTGEYGEYLASRLRAAPTSRSDGLERDLLGDGGVTLGMRGEEDGDERGDDESSGADAD